MANKIRKRPISERDERREMRVELKPTIKKTVTANSGSLLYSPLWSIGSGHEDDNSLLMTVSPDDLEEEDEAPGEEDEAPGEEDARRWLGESRKGRRGELVWEIGSCLTTLWVDDSGRYRDG